MKFKKKVLDNGLTVLFEKRDVPVTTVMLACKYGSAYETEKEKGIAHFIEHLCFKGTKKRTAREIATEVEGIGGVLNAFTHEEVTAYHVKLPSNYLNLAMNVIFDIFFNPIFPENEVERESGVICEEIKMYEDNPRAHTLDRIKANLYEAPFGMNIAGTQKNVKGMTREVLLKKHDDMYVPGNSILCVVGNNSFEEVVEIVEKMNIKKDKFESNIPKIKLKIEKNNESRQGIQQTNLALGFHFPKNSDKMKYAAEVFSEILGGGMSSNLFTEVREKRGLVYGVKTDLDIGKEYGYMIIWAGTDPAKKDEVIEICREEFSKMSGLDEEGLKKAKAQVIGRRHVDSEGSDEVAVSLVMEEVSSDAEDYYKFEEGINLVTLDDIKELAKISDYSVFSLGP